MKRLPQVFFAFSLVVILLSCTSKKTVVITTNEEIVEFTETAVTRLPSYLSTPVSMSSAHPDIPVRGEIVIVGLSKENYKVRVFDFDTEELKNISNMGDTSVAWSPDGQWIAFTGGVPGTQNRDIFMISREGEMLMRLTNSPQGESDLSWSPDGKSIVYTYNNHLEASNLALVFVVSGEIQLLTATQGYEHHPVWSPDGTKIAYLYSENDTPNQLWVMDFENRESSRILEIPIAFSKISWSPDGNLIAFITPDKDHNCGYINMVKSDGSGQQQLTNLTGCATSVVWSPDGNYLAYIGTDNSQQPSWQVYVVDTEGNQVISVGKKEDLVIYDLDWYFSIK
jgi:TolB protein